jgi:hypothetical protein
LGACQVNGIVVAGAAVAVVARRGFVAGFARPIAIFTIFTVFIDLVGAAIAFPVGRLQLVLRGGLGGACGVVAG